MGIKFKRGISKITLRPEEPAANKDKFVQTNGELRSAYFYLQILSPQHETN